MFEVLDRQARSTVNGCWFLLADVVYYFLGIKTRGKSDEQIDRERAAAD